MLPSRVTGGSNPSVEAAQSPGILVAPPQPDMPSKVGDRRVRTLFIAVAFVVLCTPLASSAAPDSTVTTTRDAVLLVATSDGPPALVRDDASKAETTTPTAPTVTRDRVSARRSLILSHVSFVTLEGLDVYTTIQAVDRGASEANPLMRGLVQNPAAFVAVKSAATASVIYLAQHVGKRNQLAAWLLMAGVNSLSAVVVVNNYRVLHQLER